MFILIADREGAVGLPPGQNPYSDHLAPPSQAAGATAQGPPTVLVPVLKRDGKLLFLS